MSEWLQCSNCVWKGGKHGRTLWLLLAALLVDIGKLGHLESCSESSSGLKMAFFHLVIQRPKLCPSSSLMSLRVSLTTVKKEEWERKRLGNDAHLFPSHSIVRTSHMTLHKWNRSCEMWLMIRWWFFCNSLHCLRQGANFGGELATSALRSAWPANADVHKPTQLHRERSVVLL